MCKVVGALSFSILGIVLVCFFVYRIAVFSNNTLFNRSASIYSLKRADYIKRNDATPVRCKKIVGMSLFRILCRQEQSRTWLGTYDLLIMKKASFLQCEEVISL